MNKASTAYEKLGLGIILIMGAYFVFVVAFSCQLNGLRPVIEARKLDYHIKRAYIAEEAHLEEARGDDHDLLLPTGFDEESCLSRRQSPLYRRRPHLPASPLLVSKLRSYEARHRRCGPHTGPFNKSAEDVVVKSGGGAYNDSRSMRECSYVVWMPTEGLGNRILTIAAAFLYALLTNRVLLLDRGADMDVLFCEPFPEASWLLPVGSPLADKFRSLDWCSNQSYGEMLRYNNVSSRPYIFLNLLGFSDANDRRVFCDQDQAYLQKIPWLVIKSNLYFIPSFFLMPMFQKELDGLFPNKETVFHLLARYLFHPKNSVWGLVTRYYDAYLSGADTIVGIQVRTFVESSPGLLNHLVDQIVSCITRESILPEIGSQKEKQQKQEHKKQRVAVVVTSLDSDYSERLRSLYWENPTRTGEVVAVSQPSKEMMQQTDKPDHDKKTWARAEIYLLSLTDKLVTSPSSTLGYSAQGLGGVRPWILSKPSNDTTPDSPCQRGVSMEPCYHASPWHNICRSRADAVVPDYVRPCEDRNLDFKLVQN